MRLRPLLLIFASLILSSALHCSEKGHPPSHLMVGPGVFNVDHWHKRALVQVEYRWEVGHHWRPLASFFIATDRNFFICGGMGYDIYFGKKVVLTPSFSPGLYFHGDGKRLGFPLNFRSAIELSYVLGNKGRISAQFNHISNARILWKNPGANSLIIFYAIPIWHSKKDKELAR